jgi:hypothetical protein
MLLFPAFVWPGGLSPLPYHLGLIALEAVKAWLFYLVLKRLTKAEALSLAAAALSLMVPHRAATHVWWANFPQAFAILMVLAALAAHLEWLSSRKLSWLLLGQAAYLSGMLAYESGAFLPLLAFGALAAERRELKTPVRDLLPFAVTLGLALLWQWGGVRWVIGFENPKSMGFSAGHALKVFAAAFECLTNRVAHVCWTTVAKPNVEGLLVLAWAGVCALALRFWPAEDKRVARRTVAGAGLGAFVGAYLPYALSSSYMPQVFGVMGRTNAGGSLAFGIMAAGLIAALRDVSRQRLAAVLLTGAFTWANWSISLDWVGAWRLEQDILAKAGKHAVSLPPGSTIQLDGPSFVGHAVGFDASWDFGPALRLTTGRGDLEGLVKGTEGTAKGPLYLFDYAADTLTPARAQTTK